MRALTTDEVAPLPRVLQDQRVATMRVNGVALEHEWWSHDGSGAAHAPLLLLHEAFGSVRSFQGFGERLARSAHRTVHAFSRQGHGDSAPLAKGGLPADYLERAGLEVVAGVRELLRLRDVVLLGLSDGASIALFHAGASALPTTAVIALGPFVTADHALEGAVKALLRGFDGSKLQLELASATGEGEATFREWAKLWTSPKRRGWSLDDAVAKVSCPVLALRGELDPLCTAAQLAHLRDRATETSVELVELTGCSTLVHQEKPGAVIAEVVRFLDALGA